MRVDNVVSVCRWLPSPEDPSAGIFVMRRLEAMARLTTLDVVQPIPWFPALRRLPRWAHESTRRVGTVPVTHRAMFYVPGVLKSLDGYWLYRSVAEGIRAAHGHRRIDAIDAHFGYPDGVGALLAGRRLSIPTFLTLRGLEVDYLDDPWIGPQLRFALRHAAGCICVSHFLRDLALERGAEPNRTVVIHNAVDRSIFKPGDRAVARRELGLAAEPRLIVAVGHLVAVKGHHTLLDAFAQLRARAPDAQLAIIGGPAHEPDYPRRLAAQAHGLGLDQAVRFVGKVAPADVARWLQAGDVFALASEREGCCNAVLEALACGTPVVTTPVGDNAHFVKDGHNGLLAPVGDAAALAAMLEQVLAHGAWDAVMISKTLEVGDWSDVGRRVLEFFAAQLRQDAPATRLPLADQERK